MCLTDLILNNVVFSSLQIQSDPINKDTEGARGSPKCHVSPPPLVRGSRCVAFQTRPEKVFLLTCVLTMGVRIKQVEFRENVRAFFSQRQSIYCLQ